MITYNKQEDKLILTIDNGDSERLDFVMKKWKFADYQGLIRFMCSIMIDTKGNQLYMEGSTGPIPVVPAAKLLVQVDNHEQAEENQNTGK